jgi:hypothetical protein
MKGLFATAFVFVFVFSFSTTIGFHLVKPSCPPPFAENVSIIMGHFAPVPFQTLITTKPKEIIASPKHA